jgi:predicted porin
MVGLLAVDGTCEAGASGCAVDRDYTRFGIDAQADIGNFRVQGVYMKAEDDNATSTATDENDAWYVQGQYTMMDKGRPTFVPLVRFDNYEKNDGQDEYREFTLNLGYYFTQNIKGYLEYWDRYDTPTGVAEDDRVTVQFDAAF